MTKNTNTNITTIPVQYYPKELSWLSFNERVLQEAADTSNPIIERIRFLGIYSNNLDEFYRVRVADVKRLIYIHLNAGNSDTATQAQQLMQQIQDKVLALTLIFDKTHEKIVKDLKKYNIFLITQDEVNGYQRHWLKSYFKNIVLCRIAPVILDSKVDLINRLNDSGTYFFVAIHRLGKSTIYATVEVPTQFIDRFVVIPPEKSRQKKYIIMLDDIIKLCLETIFKGFVKFDSLEAYSFKMTRDSAYSLNDELDESYVEKMSDSMKQRLVAEPVRFVYDHDMPKEMLKYLTRRLNISSYDSLIASGPYRNFKDFIGFPNVGRNYLENPTMPPIETNNFSNFDTVFDAISHKDILLYYPYHRFINLSEFIRQAAFDPNVKHIRINIYRIAKNSRIIHSLIDAVDNGKNVTVVVELRARFDEEANIKWSKNLRDAGITVFLGVPSLKIHSKLCVVTREEKGTLLHYAHIGTGNFNEQTAKIYTDFSLFTKNQEIAEEAVHVFDFIQQPYRRHKFQHLHVSPVNARTKIVLLIKQEIQNAQKGIKAKITLKLNNLVDPQLIDELYKASRAGVKIRALVRGMCSLVPGVKGLSDNIYVISIVDRFLEHPRVMVYENAGDQRVIISSADWMSRNMDERIEVGCPIYDKLLAGQIISILELQFKDTVKARLIDVNQANKYVPRGNRKKIRSQVEIYNYLKALENKYEPRNYS
jgi:polyphosphate kinase